MHILSPLEQGTKKTAFSKFEQPLFKLTVQIRDILDIMKEWKGNFVPLTKWDWAEDLY